MYVFLMLCLYINYKILGIMYGTVGIIFMCLGCAMSIIIRLELSMNMYVIIVYESFEIYNLIIWLHGINMIFLFIMPMLYSGYGNIMLPIYCIACEVPYPRINNIAWVILIYSSLMFYTSLLVEFLNGIGWTMYPPLSSNIVSLSSTSTLLIVFWLLINGTSSTLWSINLICIPLSIMSPGVLIIHSIYMIAIITTTILLLYWLPILIGALLLLLMDSTFCCNYFLYEYGGDIILYQHLFWIFGHPEVYVLIIPIFGLICIYLQLYLFSRPLMSIGWLMSAINGIALIGLLVWYHHMYVISMETDTRAYFTIMSICIAVPWGIKIIDFIYICY